MSLPALKRPCRHGARGLRYVPPVPKHPTFDALVAREAIPAELADRAAQVPLHRASSCVGRLVAAGGEPARMLRAVAEQAGIEVAPRSLIATSRPVNLSQLVARALRVITACPVKRDPDGMLHVLIAEPESREEVERLLPGCRLYLAHEDQIRDLLMDLFPSGSSIPDGAPVGAIDIDMEASSRMPAAPAPPAPPPPAPSVAPADPLAPRASGSHSRRSINVDDETMRIERSPRAAPQAQRQPQPQVQLQPRPAVAAPDQTEEEALLPGSIVHGGRAALTRAFWRGVAVGAGVVAALAAVLLGALLSR